MGRTSDAQKRAVAKYQKSGRMRQVALSFGPGEQDEYEHLMRQPNRMRYIKDLIRRDMREGGGTR